MHVVLADPPAFTPPYDHELASALARAGATVDLVTAPFRFGERPVPIGYALREEFYPRSSRVDRRRLRLAVKALEHPGAMRRLLGATADVLHLQWLAAPELDRALLRARTPLVFTAHDLLPRRTARRTRLWRALFGRFERIVVHSQRGRDRLDELGVPRERLRVIPHPVFRSDPPRRDDGRTVLSLGVIRPYKGLGEAIDATLRLPDTRLLVAGDPRIPLGALRARAGARADWRLGYLGRAQLEAALSEATVAVLLIVPVDCGRPLIWIVGEAPLATVPSWHVTVPLECEHVPCEGTAESKAMPAGSVSVTTVPVAARGPALPTVRL